MLSFFLASDEIHIRRRSNDAKLRQQTTVIQSTTDDVKSTAVKRV